MLLVFIGFLIATPLTAQSRVEIMASGPHYLRLVCRGEPADLALAASQVWLLGAPLEGEADWQVVEARVARRIPWGQVEEALEDLPVDGPAQWADGGHVRGQRMLEISFPPQRRGDELLVYDRVVVEVRFSSGSSRALPSTAADPWGETYLREILLNYQQARPWRQARRPGRGKRAAGLDHAGQIRLVVRGEGIYRLTGADLVAAGVALESVDPDALRLYYGGGAILPEGEAVSPPMAERRQKAILVEYGGDGHFDASDQILFYAEAAQQWVYDAGSGTYQYRRNPYTEENIYWLGWNGASGQRVEEVDGRPGDEGRVVATYRQRLHQESDNSIAILSSTIPSGYEWYWETFQGNARNFATVIQDAAPGPVDIRLRFWGHTDTRHRFQLKWNEEERAELAFDGPRARTLHVRVPEGAQEGVNLLGLVHLDDRATRLDWYQLEYERSLRAQRGELVFDAPAGEGRAQFRLQGFSARPRLFRVGRAGTTEIVDFDFDGAAGTVVFADSLGSVPARYWALEADRWQRPAGLELAAPADLLDPAGGADYLVISHADFMPAAQRLAQWRGQDDRFGRPLVSRAIDVQAIYDEFSGGRLDPAAIRNFLQYAYQNWQRAPFFVALMGDGTYDYKNRGGLGGRVFIPAYQDGDSTYDEWYVRLAGGDSRPDMAIGRLSVQNLAEATAVVDKILAYDQAPEIGPWQGRVLLVADDIVHPQWPTRVESYFVQDAERLQQTGLLPAGLDVVKHYIGGFALEGREKPAARAEFIRLFNEGALLLTYLGHGNPDVFAHEQLFVLSRDQGELANEGRLPLVFTAASQVGVFDDPGRDSIPEALLKMRHGGVIGMISATRIGYHRSNVALAVRFHRQLFASGRSHVPAGLALMEAKQQVATDEQGPYGRRNIQRYSLFGDPAQRLAQPRYGIVLEVADTLQALAEVPVRGVVVDAFGQVQKDYQGQVRVQAFDSSVPAKLEGFPYIQVGAPLFRGLYPVQEGRFEVLFRVPKDINYQSFDGRLSAYAWTAAGQAGFGSVEGLVLAGTAPGVAADIEGPQIEVGVVGRPSFRSGDQLPSKSILQVLLSDPSGINITGETGHEIELELAGAVYKLTRSFVSHQGDYRHGVAEFPVPDLAPGTYRLSLKAWDSFNNSARAEVEVRIARDKGGLLSDVLFYPNPMADEGHFTYQLAEAVPEVSIRVFSLGGRLVAHVQGAGQVGYNQVAWRPGAELANGAYLYRVEVSGRGGETAVVQVVR